MEHEIPLGARETREIHRGTRDANGARCKRHETHEGHDAKERGHGEHETDTREVMFFFLASVDELVAYRSMAKNLGSYFCLSL
jgi:hypothetical protein